MRRPAGRPCVRGRADFNPRTPVRGATNEFGIDLQLDVFQSTHPCAGCDPYVTEPVADTAISIHAPLCGVRQFTIYPLLLTLLFQSTHPCAGCDQDRPLDRPLPSQFQSTHPCAGCDALTSTRMRPASYFNPRTPVRGATRAAARAGKQQQISIHAPLCGVRRGHNPRAGVLHRISIHAPLCGVRLISYRRTTGTADFNPRTPVRSATPPPAAA